MSGRKMSGRKILVVDDEEHLRELVQACLEDLAGWETLTAASGETCLQILQTEQVNAILGSALKGRIEWMWSFEQEGTDGEAFMSELWTTRGELQWSNPSWQTKLQMS